MLLCSNITGPALCLASTSSPFLVAQRSVACISRSCQPRTLSSLFSGPPPPPTSTRPSLLPKASAAPAGRMLHPFRMASTLPRLPLFEAISKHDPDSTAVVHCLSGRSFKYGELLPDVARTRDRLYEAAGKSDIRGERIAFLVENSYDYVGTQLAFISLPSRVPGFLDFLLAQKHGIVLNKKADQRTK